jgi:ATP-dependent 26S proteasome regulatory subunit
MNAIVLQLDLGEHAVEARSFKREHPDLTLGSFLRVYPATFIPGEEPSRRYLDMPLSAFVVQPVAIPGGGDESGEECIQGSGLRRELDACWQREQQDVQSLVCSLDDDLEQFSPAISDNEAVRLAYHQEMDTIADFLGHGLSVLVQCDKMLTDYIYEFVCHQAGRKVVLDSDVVEEQTLGIGSRLDQALQGGQQEPLANLPVLLHNLKNDEILVIRSLDMLDSPALVELLYQRSAKGDKPQLLAFLDPSLEVKKVLTDRFAVHIPITGLPRHIEGEEGQHSYTVSRLLTRKERSCFAVYDSEGLYKNVSGLHAIQFRNAMRYVGAKVAVATDSREIYQVIRQFKLSSAGADIEIPDTAFADIGGYAEIKQKLKHIIHLIAGPVAGLDDKQRGQLIPRGFIFYGPPGTGKTLFAKAVANEMNATIQMVSGPEIMDKYVGQSESNLRQLFATARRNAPAVIFFDEFDSIASQRSTYADGGARANNAVVAQLLTELDGFQPDRTVLVIGTTNRIDIIDEALMRPSRLQPLKIGLPDKNARCQVADLHARGFGVCDHLKRLAGEIMSHVAASGDELTEEKAGELLSSFTELGPAVAARYDQEKNKNLLLGELRELAKGLADLFSTACGDGAQMPILDDLYRHFCQFGHRHGLNFSPDQGYESQLTDGQQSLVDELQEIFFMVNQERQAGISPESFYRSVIELVAVYTEQFNNDELRAIFQESSLEYHLEGRIITPRYLGGKIRQIQSRRQQQSEVHLHP